MSFKSVLSYFGTSSFLRLFRIKPFLFSFLFCATYFIFLLLNGADLFFSNEFFLLFLLSGAFIISKHKMSWTFSLTLKLIVFSQMVSVIIVNLNYLDSFLIINFLILTIFILMHFIITVLHFKAPHVISRSSGLGLGNRYTIDVNICVMINGLILKRKLNNISSSGLAFSLISEDSNLFKEGEVIDIEINDIKMIKTKARVVRIDEGSCSLQFVGWSLSSIREHFKILQIVQNARLAHQKSRYTIGNKQDGFTLIESMIVCAISAILVIFSANTFSDINKAYKQSQISYNLEAIKNV